MAIKEQKILPAIAFAFEVKARTARNLNIGTRRADYAIYLIASKRFGDLDIHGNVAYTILGKPSGVSVKNTWTFSVAAEYTLDPKWDLFCEVMYVSSGRGEGSGAGEGTNLSEGSAINASSEGDGLVSKGTAVAEVGGIEIFGTIGIRHHLSANVDIFGSFSYENADAKLFRTGFTVKF